MLDPEFFIHINQQLHTGHIQDATLELLSDSVAVANSGLEQAINVAKIAGKNGSGYMIGVLLGPNILPWYLRKRWGRKENIVLRVLDETKVLRGRGNPVQLVELVFGQAEAPRTRGPIDMAKIVGFWSSSKIITEMLFEKEGVPGIVKLSTLEWATRAFVASRQMHGALYDKVYPIN